MISLPPIIAASVALSFLALSSAGAQDPVTGQAESGAPPKEPAANQEKKTSIYAFPTEQFNALETHTKPMWRQQYRAEIPRNLPDRFKAAIALGALDTDLVIACQARDLQQIRNLLLDQQALEKLLGICDQLSELRAILTTHAEQEKWPLALQEMEKMVAKECQVLGDQRDLDLAQLLHAGLWLRCWHVSTSVVESKKVKEDILCIGSHAQVEDVNKRLPALSETTRENKSVRLLTKRLEAIGRIWRAPAPETAAERVHNSGEIFNELMEYIVQDKPIPPKEKQPANPPPPASNPEPEPKSAP